MPLPIMLAHRLVQRLSQVRRRGELDYLRPDGKSQVSVRYADGKPVAVETVVISTQHSPDATLERIREDIVEKVILPTIPADLIDPKKIVYHINPTGRFVTGGPMGDTGLTGRKIIVDTYGGSCPHGGGAFSGKDPTKVDRSACYMARHVAKNIVAAGLAERAQVQVAYAIGVAEPVSIMVETFGTGKVPTAQARADGAAPLRLHARRHHQVPESPAAHLQEDGRLRTLRAHRARVHLGAHRPRQGSAGRRGALSGAPSRRSL